MSLFQKAAHHAVRHLGFRFDHVGYRVRIFPIDDRKVLGVETSPPCLILILIALDVINGIFGYVMASNSIIRLLSCMGNGAHLSLFVLLHTYFSTTFETVTRSMQP